MIDIYVYTYVYVYVGEGIPYEVVVVAFTSVGRGEENNRTVFFSRELFPTKPPGDVNIKQLNSTSINVTWTPLTLFEARGFPLYRVVLTPMDANSNSSNSSKIVVVTKSSFAIITNLSDSIQYYLVVGVRTGGDLVKKQGGITVVSVRYTEGNNGNYITLDLYYN